MPRKTLKDKIKKKAALNEAHRKDIRFIKTIAVLKGKGLLRTNLPIAATKSARLDINHAIWAGRTVEPRILEVLPAAILHFPKTFLNLANMPPDLEKVVKMIRANKEDGEDFEGIPFAKMRHWANTQLRDRRTKPVETLKQTRTFRLRQDAIDKLAKLVEAGTFPDQTSAIEAAIDKL